MTTLYCAVLWILCIVQYYDIICIVQYYEYSVLCSIMNTLSLCLSKYIEISQSLVGLEENICLVCKYSQVVQKLYTHAVKVDEQYFVQVSSMPKAKVQTKGSEQSS